ncbi:MAG: M23 family metallopeptidase [Candidatus Magasanikbacteria bacterium]|nr:M23 family metallopeptidase [Candidatus Magasanikbacteria bacterium]
MRHRLFGSFLPVLFLSIFIFGHPDSLQAVEIRSYQVTDYQQFIGNPNLPTQIWNITVPVPWSSGRVVLSSTPDGTGDVDVGPQLEVYGSNTGDATRRFIYRAGCSETPMSPLDITHLMGPRYAHLGGDTQLFIRYNRQSCVNWVKENNVYKMVFDVSPMYIVHFDDSDTKIKPFLALPWDYAASGRRFDQAALSIETQFDHQYPVFNTPDGEISSDSASLITYTQEEIKSPRSGYDGYSWGFKAGIIVGTPVLATENGIATYLYSNQCGNTILIDHLNGFQTRYCQLAPDGLITTDLPVAVTQGQIIGKVGLPVFTPTAELYISIVEDTNKDGVFEDDIPNGVIDPFGWQGKDSDPWELVGNRSQYLWNKITLDDTYTLPSVGARYFIGDFTVDFPKNTLAYDTILNFKHISKIRNISVEEDDTRLYESISNRLKLTMSDGFGEIISILPHDFTVSLSYDPHQLERYHAESIGIYSSSTGSMWSKEVSVIDTAKKTISTSTNEMSSFAILGERLDSIPPVTTATLSGILDREYYVSAVEVFLSVSDAPLEYSLGEEFTMYKINKDIWKLYQSPLVLTEEASYLIQFFSQDKDGNTEQASHIDLIIDYHPPTVPPTSTPTYTSTPTPTLNPTYTPTHTPTIQPSLAATPTTTLQPTPTSVLTAVRKLPLQTSTPRPTPTLEILLDEEIQSGDVLGVRSNQEPLKRSNFMLIIFFLALLIIALFIAYMVYRVTQEE